MQKLMQSINSVETVPVIEVAKLLHTSPEKVSAAIANGTFPVGLAVLGNPTLNTKTTTIILRNRLEAYLQAKDLGGMDDVK